jgi:hypothetical protein
MDISCVQPWDSCSNSRTETSCRYTTIDVCRRKHHPKERWRRNSIADKTTDTASTLEGTYEVRTDSTIITIVQSFDALINVYAGDPITAIPCNARTAKLWAAEEFS